MYDIVLTLIERIGPKTAASLVEMFGSAEGALSRSYEELTSAGVSSSIAHCITREQNYARARAIIEQCRTSGIRILVRGSEHYPQLLAECPDAPHVLYVRGDLNFNCGKWMSVVGTRRASSIGLHATECLVADYAAAFEDGVIVSGLAFGIDKAAHVAAMAHRLPTVAVMAGWVDDIVPRSHYYVARRILAQGGAIVSDMPPGTIISGGNFLSRNRIIAGLSHLTVVAESAAKGGSLVTADIASSYDRELFAMPGRPDDVGYEGTNLLIKSNKAILYQNVGDIAQAMGWQRAAPSRTQVDPRVLPVYLMDVFVNMPDTEPTTLDEVCSRLSISVGDASSRMVQLEVRGFIKSLQGKLYQKAKF